MRTALRDRARPRAGFTLIEFAVATGCLVVLVGTSAAVAVGIAKGIRQNEEETLAQGVARGLLAELRARPEVPAGPEIRPLPIPYESARRLREANAEVRWEAWGPGLSKATMTLAWKDSRGAARTIELVTLVEQGGSR
jgi:hypothetical protein